MLRRDLDSHGETGEISEFENMSDEDETNEKAPLYPKSDSSKRKSEHRPSHPPRKKAKVTLSQLNLENTYMYASFFLKKKEYIILK